MNVCKRCGKENQAHYKFCLGCGGDLTASAGTGSAAMAKTMMADPSMVPAPSASAPRSSGFTAPTPPVGLPAPLSAVPTPPPMAGVAFNHQAGAGQVTPTPFSPPPTAGHGAPLPGMPPPQVARVPTPGAGLIAPTPFTPPPPSAQPGGFVSGPPKPKSTPGMPSPLSLTPTPAIALFGGSLPAALAGTPAGVPLASTAPLAPVAQAHPSAPPAPSMSQDARMCPGCGAEVPVSFAFCGACGHRLGAGVAPAQSVATPPPFVEPRPQGILTLIRPDGTEGGSHNLVEGVNAIGRTRGPVFEHDGYLSPLHAEVIVNAAGAVLHDLDSLNGVFVKITAEEELVAGDIFRIGQELMRFDTVTAPAPLEDGTEIMGSPNPGYWGRISVIIGRDIDGSAFPLLTDGITLGRERGEINFPDDGYVSGLHARLQTRGGKFFLSDLGSSNGTFFKIRGERIVPDGSFILFGQQLFRLTLSVV